MFVDKWLVIFWSSSDSSHWEVSWKKEEVHLLLSITTSWETDSIEHQVSVFFKYSLKLIKFFHNSQKVLIFYDIDFFIFFHISWIIFLEILIRFSSFQLLLLMLLFELFNTWLHLSQDLCRIAWQFCNIECDVTKIIECYCVLFSQVSFLSE